MVKNIFHDTDWLPGHVVRCVGNVGEHQHRNTVPKFKNVQMRLHKKYITTRSLSATICFAYSAYHVSRFTRRLGNHQSETF